MISDKLKCIFLHPDKCAGKSIEKAIWNVNAENGSSDHRLPERYIKDYGETVWEEYFKFGFSRNPWDRVVSVYHARKLLPKILDGKILKMQDSFEEWIHSWNLHISPQSIWFFFNEKKINFVGRIENYKEDFEKVKNVLNLDASIELPHLNASKHDFYTNYYDKEMVDIVYTIFKKDIINFNYEFGQ